VGDGDAARLVVSLVALPVSSLALSTPPQVVSRWSVDLAGNVKKESVR
jgi:hypothetical protein